MTWSEPIDALELPALCPPSVAEGEVDGEGRWSPPRWARKARSAPTPAAADPMELAFARGYEAGRRESEGVAIADVEPVLRALQRAAERIELAETVFERDRAQVVTVLSLAVARHLMLAEVKGDPDYVTRLVTRALEQVSQDAPIEVRLHPEDLRATEAAGGVAPGGTPAIKWTGDPTLSRGDCIVESPTRLVDGRIDRALLRLVERLSHE